MRVDTCSRTLAGNLSGLAALILPAMYALNGSSLLAHFPRKAGCNSIWPSRRYLRTVFLECPVSFTISRIPLPCLRRIWIYIHCSLVIMGPNLTDQTTFQEG